MFTLIAEKIDSVDFGAIETYGIRASDGTAVQDISCQKNQVAKMVDLFNRMEVSSLHMRDVVEDLL